MGEPIKILYFIALCFLTANCTTSLKKPFFWEIEKAGKRSYVMGTIHSGVSSKDLPVFIHHELEESDAVAFEVKFSSRFLYKTYPEYVKAFISSQRDIIQKNIDNDKKLTSLFTPQEWKRVLDKMVPLGIAPNDLVYYTPQLISVLLDGNKNIYVNGYEAYILQAGNLDRELYGKATSLKKSIIELDSVERMKPECWDQLYKFNVLYKLDHDQYDSVNDFVKLVEWYQKGHEDNIPVKHDMNSLDLDKCLLDERNKRWLEVINKAHQKYTKLFIVGGVRHFTGDDNVLLLLQKNGYRVQRRTEK